MDKDDLNKTFGNYIKSIRTKKGLIQKDLAAILGNNFQNISSLERGKYSPSLFYISKLSTAFELSITEFISGFEQFKMQHDIIK